MLAADEEGERLIWLWLISAKLLVIQRREEKPVQTHAHNHTHPHSLCPSCANRKCEETSGAVWVKVKLTLRKLCKFPDDDNRINSIYIPSFRRNPDIDMDNVWTCMGGVRGRREVKLGQAAPRWRERKVKAVLSDIYSVQGVKRVICHLIENLCGSNWNAKTHFPLSSHTCSPLLFAPTG